MRDITRQDLEFIPHIIDFASVPFRVCTAHPDFYIENTVGNACYTHLADDRYTIQHELNSGGRLVIDVKYEPDWEDEESSSNIQA